MDTSTLILHRALLRLAKGGVKSYERWIADQAAQSLVTALKEKKAELSKEERAARGIALDGQDR